MNDQTMIAALKQADETAFRVLFEEYHEKVYLFVFSRSHSTYIAEETTQLTFIKLWQYRLSLDETIPLAAQLFRIAKTVWIDILRKELNQLRLASAQHMANASTCLPEDTLGEKELQQHLQLAINNMPPVRKKIFQLSRHQGMSHKEISQTLSVSVKTVETHIHLALKQLKHLFFLILIGVLAFFF